MGGSHSVRPGTLSTMQDLTIPARVSVVITTYNYERFVAAAIESVLRQTVRPDEIVVVDDGSTDATAAVVARYAARGVRYIRQANAGPGAARNRGIRETRGDLIAFLDADDRWLPDKLARQLAHLRRYPAAGLVTGGEWQVFARVSTFAQWIDDTMFRAGTGEAAAIRMGK